MRTRIGRTLVALALAAPLIAVVAPSTPIAAADPRLRTRQRHRARRVDHVRQRALLPGQPQHALGSRADAAPERLHPGQRRHAVEQPHAADRAHGRGQPGDLHRSVRRPSRDADQQHLPDLEAGRDRRLGGLVRVLDRIRTTTAGTIPSTRWSTRTPCRPRRRPPTSRRRHRGCRGRERAATSATSRPPTWCSRTHPFDIPKVFGRDRRRRRAVAADPNQTSSTSRRPTTSASPCTARRAAVSARTRRR